MTATAENSVSHKNEAKSLLFCAINLDSRFLQAPETEEVYLHAPSFDEPSYDMGKLLLVRNEFR
jgi:hypothetical protein